MPINKETELTQVQPVGDPVQEDLKTDEKKYNHRLSYLFSFCAGLSFAVANYIASDLSINLGFIWIFLTFPSATLIWVLFHIYNHQQLNKKEPTPFWWSSEKSVYFKVNEAGEKVFDWHTFGAPIRRIFCQLSIQILLFFTFKFAAESNINTGIITSCFATSLIFTSVYFYFKHSQKLTVTDGLGICMVISCVVIISLSGKASSTDGVEEEFSWYRFMAVLSSILCGAMFTINSIDLHYGLTKTSLSAY